MENSGLISVIIPVYNVEEYLRECIDSVLSQTYENYEIILVDDGSTDNSGKICDEYVEKYHKIIVVHKENGGLSDARNTGLLYAKGEYIYFLDSDDYIVPECFAELVTIIRKDASDFVFFDALSFEDNNKDFTIPQRYKRKKEYDTNKGETVLKTLIDNKEFHSSVPLCFIKSEFLKKQKLDFVLGVFYEDTIFTYKIFMLASRVAYCPKSLYHRRYRKASIMTTGKNKRYFDSICRVYEEVLSFSKNENKFNLDVAQKYIARCAFNVFNNYEKLSIEDKIICKKQLDEIKKIILKDNAYGNKALKMRCYGKVFWFIYKGFEKTVGRLFV